MTEQLVAENITYLYPNGRGISDLHMTAEKGEALAVSGSNGSGKTTLIKVLSTLFRPQRGSILIGGYDAVRQKDQARRMFFPVFDESAHIGHASGAENLTFFLDLYGSAAADRIDHYARHFSLDLDLPADEYSLGMKRKLVLIEAFLSERPVLIFDEPTLGLDSAARSAFFGSIRESAEEGTTVIFGTNRAQEASRADRVLFMNTGKLSTGAPGPDPGGMIELRITMEQEEFTEYVVSPEEIPDAIARLLPFGVPQQIRIRSRSEGDLVWTDAALEKAGRAPSPVRRMVIGITERYAREKGYHRITPEVVEEARQRFEPR
jgi:ABC-type multidrug transport system ATPase subunit